LSDYFFLEIAQNCFSLVDIGSDFFSIEKFYIFSTADDVKTAARY
jgi:hypothetical protein